MIWLIFFFKSIILFVSDISKFEKKYNKTRLFKLNMKIHDNKKNNEILLIEILIPIILKKNIIKQHTNKMEPISEKFDNAGNLNDFKKDFCI